VLALNHNPLDLYLGATRITGLSNQHPALWLIFRILLSVFFLRANGNWFEAQFISMSFYALFFYAVFKNLHLTQGHKDFLLCYRLEI
jgi:hypothetical protein